MMDISVENTTGETIQDNDFIFSYSYDLDAIIIFTRVTELAKISDSNNRTLGIILLSVRVTFLEPGIDVMRIFTKTNARSCFNSMKLVLKNFKYERLNI